MRRRALLLAAGTSLAAGCASAMNAPRTPLPATTESATPTDTPTVLEPPSSSAEPTAPDRSTIVAEFSGRKPQDFGIELPGVVLRGQSGVALTFDACGGGKLGNGFDSELIDSLVAHNVPATLFLNGRWISANPGIAADLAANPQFELANHGWAHRPLTVAGQKAYGIAGTADPGEAFDEIMQGQDALAELTGRRSRWFRPGTAWVDDVGVAIAARLGVKVVAFSINADAGATASTGEVTANLARASDGDITLGHFNRPEGHTAEGLKRALPTLLNAGVSFRTLTDALL